MPLRKEDAHHALELLEVYHAQLANSNDPQLRQSLERVINTLKSRLFDALLDIQEYYEVTIANETRAAQQKAAADMSAGRWLPNAGDISTLAQAHFGLMATPGDVAALGGSVQYPYEEQGATVYDDWIFDEVKLLKPESGGYGFSIAGGRDAPHVGTDPSIFITKLTPGSPAANDGRLVIGAIVLSVNDMTFVNVTRPEAVASLKQAGDRVHMIFKRPKYDPNTLVDIMLTKTTRGLGFSIAGGVGNEHVPGDPGLFITRLIDGGAAGVDGRLQVGDRIVQVNDIRFERITHEEAVQVLKATAQTVRIIAQKPVYPLNEFGMPISDPAAYPYAGPPQPVYQPPPQPAYQPPPQPVYQPPPQPVYQPPPQPVKLPEPPAPTPAPAPEPEPAPAPRTKTKAKTAPPPPEPAPAPVPEPVPIPVVETRSAAPEQEALPPPPVAPVAKPKKKKRTEPTPPAVPAEEPPAPAPAPAPIVVAAQVPAQTAEPSMPAPPPKPKKKPPPKAPPAPAQEGEAPVSAPPPAPKKREPTGPPVRKVTLRRGEGGLGFNIVGGEGTDDGIFISYVASGGAAEASGDIQGGDQILAVNGRDIRNASHEEAARALKGAGEKVELTLVYKPAEYAAFNTKLAEMHQEEPAPTPAPAPAPTVPAGGRQLVANPTTPANPSLKKTTLIVRALFDYDPSKDSGLPSKGLAFRYGDVLAVINSSDDEWWQAKRLRSNGADDSAPGIVPSKKRVEKKERARLRRVGWGGQPGDKKKDDDEEIPVASYLPVQLMEVNYTRPVVILGPFKDRLNDDLQNEDPNRFATFVPHTTREKRDQEVDGRDYYFVASREQMERDIEAGLFIEAGHYQGNLYGTSVKAVVDVALSGKHCILDVSGNALKRLEQNNLFPIAIFVKPKSTETIMEINKRMNEDQCKKAFERAQKTESDFIQFFTAVVQGDSARDYQTRTLEAIDAQNSKTIWVPLRDVQI